MNRCGWNLLGVFLVFSCAVLACRLSFGGPLEPAEALDQFVVAPGLKVELVACEPEVIDPVSIRFDEDGRLWVAEMRDYPHGPGEGQSPQSRIRVLEDRDGDGRFETSKTFADRLLFATGLQPWRGGVIVTLAGRVVYLQDRDGDGRADREETWFTGFVEANPQLRANHPRLAFDNQIYVANGLRGGSIVDQRRDGAEPVSISGMDFQFDPLAPRCQPVAGMGQFGVTFDDFGNRFVVSNRNPLRHVVLEDRYLRRSSALAVTEVASDVAVAGEASHVFPLTEAFTTSTLHAGQFTAACGVLIYRGSALGKAFDGNAFTCEPTGSLVHCEVLQPRGATFVSQPAREGVEFLASTDDWFRPVDLENGPDGALYVVDMYRAVIEHPQWMPPEQVRHSDFEGGKDRGRIYRIVPTDRQSPNTKPQLSGFSSAELVELFEHNDAWWRETAARLLLERQNQSVKAALESLAVSGKSPAARIHALWALEGLGVLTQSVVVQAITDPHPRVREHAVRLAERWLAESPELVKDVSSLAHDDDARLRFQVALSLGEATGSDELSNDVLEALRSLACHAQTDEWTRLAVASSVGSEADRLLTAVLSSSPGNAEHIARTLPLVSELAELVGADRNAEACRRVMADVVGLPTTSDAAALQWTTIASLSAGLARRGESLLSLVDESAQTSPDLASGLDQIFVQAAEVADDSASEDATRRMALAVLRYARGEQAVPVLCSMVTEETNQRLRLLAIEILGARRDPEIASLLLDGFQEQTPAVRRALLDALCETPDRCHALLGEIAAGEIASGELDPLRASRLLKHRDKSIRRHAQELLATTSADREKVAKEYRPALEMSADILHGREVFRRECSTCHRVAGIGVDVGPDIADSRTKTPEQLFYDILLPNRAIDGNYISYTLMTNDGRVLNGLVTTETATSVTLKQAENKTVTVLRDDIEELRSSGVSLMPEGLERNISVAEMADLILFIKEWRYLDDAAD